MKRFLLVLALVVGFFAVSAQAQGISREGVHLDSNFGIGARAMGMGGAHLAAASDASAMYWNPAGLVFIRRIELASTLSRENNQVDTRYFGTPANAEESDTRLNSLGVVYPFPTLRGALVVGAAVNRVHSFDSIYRHEGYNPFISYGPDDLILGGENYEVETQATQGGLYAWTFSGAMDVSEQLSLGLSLNIWDGSYESQFRSEETDVEDVWWHDQIVLTQEDDFDIDGYNLTLGGIYRATRHLNFGFSVNSKVDIKFDGEQYQKVSQTCDDGADEADCYEGSYTEYYLYEDREIPWAFNFGIAYTQKMFVIAADVNYMDWSETFTPDPELNEEQLYDEVLRLRVGGEFIVPNSPMRLRAGFYTDPLAYQGTKINDDRAYFTCGAGFILDRVFTIDLAYVGGSWERFNQDHGYLAETTSSRFFLTGSYRF